MSWRSARRTVLFSGHPPTEGTAMHHSRSLFALGGVLILAAVAPVATAAADACPSATSAGETVFTCPFTTNEQSVTVPAGVTGLHVVAAAGAGSGDGGRGATVTAYLAVATGRTLSMEVGGGADQNNH